MCRLSSERSSDGGKTKIAGNNTIHGQIATFMENLHMTYNEVFEVIPYRNLILMQKDKLHTVYGDLLVETSARDRIKYKKKG